MEQFDIIIIGGGPAGLTAAVYARRAGKSVLVLEKASFGGQIATSPRVDNFPAAAGISGAELAERLYNQAEEVGARIELEEALSLEQGQWKTVTTDYSAYQAKAVILATGMKHRTLGLPEEEETAGVSYCSVCDGAFHRDQPVAVVGGGNSALQEALFLSDICSRVYLIHRREEFRGDPILQDKVRAKENIQLVLNTVPEALLSGNGVLSGLKLRNTVTNEVSSLPIHGLFVAIGHQPETGLTPSLTDDHGFLNAGESCDLGGGIFAAGDCRAKQVRQMITACADGAVAALAACAYCE